MFHREAVTSGGMWRGAIVILVAATFVGAMMPGGSPADAVGEPAVVQLVPPSEHGSGEPGEDASSSSDSSGGHVRLERQPDGHFYAKVKVNYTTVDFMVDTGASGISLSTADARRANVDFDQSEFEIVGEGASGVVKGQRVLLDSVKLGPERATRVPAVVLDGGGQSLLGQSFLERFGSVEIRGDTMTLR